jgi:hypothetical protein
MFSEHRHAQMNMKKKYIGPILGITSGIGLAAAKDLWPSHAAVAHMVLYSIAVLGILLICTWPHRHLPRFALGMLVVLACHGLFLYFAMSIFPFGALLAILIAAFIESIVLFVIMLQILAPEGMRRSLGVIASGDKFAHNGEAHTVTAKYLLIPKPLSILVWIAIAISVAGINAFRFADFQNRNAAYYFCMIGNYTSYASPVFMTLLIAFLWRGYRKGFLTPKILWLQLGVLLFLTLSLGVVFFGS